MLDEIERIANWLSDNDHEWWPFLFMRPPQEQRMGNRRVLALAVLYGVFAGMLANVCLVLGGKSVHLLLFPASATFVFFVFFRATFAYFWNRRADRLNQENAPSMRLQAWQRGETSDE
jgi:hypothetical protein